MFSVYELVTALVLVALHFVVQYEGTLSVMCLLFIHVAEGKQYMFANGIGHIHSPVVDQSKSHRPALFIFYF